MGREGPVVLTLAIAFGVGAGLIWLATLHPTLRRSADGLWAIYRSEFLIAGAVVIPAAMGTDIFLLALLVFAWRAQVELFRLFDVISKGRTQRAAMLGAAVVVVTGRYVVLPILLGVLAAAILTVVFVAAISEPRSVRAERARIALASLMFPGLLAALIAAMRAGENGFAWIFFVYATVEIGDAFALLCGKLFGRSHPLPKLSPKKTVEGLVAGLIFGGLGGFLVARFVLLLPPAHALRCVVLILLAGTAGDLLTSALKRHRGKKDFSPVLNLHGGVLDIYDSFLLAAPVVFLLRPVLLA